MTAVTGHTSFSVAHTENPFGGGRRYTMIAERALVETSDEARAVLDFCRRNFGCSNDPAAGWSFGWWPTRQQAERTLIVDIYDPDAAALFMLKYAGR